MLPEDILTLIAQLLDAKHRTNFNLASKLCHAASITAMKQMKIMRCDPPIHEFFRRHVFVGLSVLRINLLTEILWTSLCASAVNLARLEIHMIASRENTHEWLFSHPSISDVRLHLTSNLTDTNCWPLELVPRVSVVKVRAKDQESYITDDFFRALATHCHELTHLTVRCTWSSKQPNDVYRQLMQSCSKIQSIKSTFKVTPRGDLDFDQLFVDAGTFLADSLQTFVIEAVVPYHEDPLLELVRKCKHLRRFTPLRVHTAETSHLSHDLVVSTISPLQGVYAASAVTMFSMASLSAPPREMFPIATRVSARLSAEDVAAFMRCLLPPQLRFLELTAISPSLPEIFTIPFGYIHLLLNEYPQLESIEVGSERAEVEFLLDGDSQPSNLRTLKLLYGNLGLTQYTVQFPQLFARMPYLQSLFVMCTNAGIIIRSVALHCRQLERLEMDVSVSEYADLGYLVMLGDRLTDLKISLYDESLSCYVARLPNSLAIAGICGLLNLETLSLSGILLDSKSAGHLFGSLKYLRRVSVQKAAISDGACMEIARCGQHLRTLHANQSFVSFPALTHLLQHCGTLGNLTFSVSSDLEEEAEETARQIVQEFMFHRVGYHVDLMYISVEEWEEFNHADVGVFA